MKDHATVILAVIGLAAVVAGLALRVPPLVLAGGLAGLAAIVIAIVFLTDDRRPQ